MTVDPIQELRAIIRELMTEVFIARREALIAQHFARFANPAVPEATLQRIRQETCEAFQPVLDQLASKPFDEALKLLRDFHGPIQ